MANEGVEILIEADDRASAKLNKVGDNLEKTVKGIGSKAKASTELVGTLANSLGNTQFAGFAGGLAQVTERISAFSEVASAGSVGAAAFGAGLAGVVAVGAFQVGQAIGNAVFETERWKQELEAATVKAQELNAELQKVTDERFSGAQEDIGLIRDPKERLKAQEALRDQLKTEVAGLHAQLSNAEREAERRTAKRESFSEGLGKVDLSGIIESDKVQKENTETIRENIKVQEERLKLIEKQLGREAEVEAKRQANAAADKSDAFLAGLREEVELLAKKQAIESAENIGTPEGTAEAERLRAEVRAIEAAKNTVSSDPEARGEAEMLLAERDAFLAKAEAEKQAEQEKEVARRKEEAAAEAEKQAEQEKEVARRKEEAAAERVADLQKKEVERLHEREIAITQGAEAAKAYALEQQGLDETAAKSLAAQDAALRKREEEADKQKQLANFQPGVKATESRLLTRGPAERGIDQIAAAADKQVTLLDQIKAALLNPPTPSGASARIVMVGP